MCIGPLEPGEEAKQRGLTRARRAEQRHEMPRINLHAHVFERSKVAVGLAEVFSDDAHGG
jgi:hypothetical protein